MTPLLSGSEFIIGHTRAPQLGSGQGFIGDNAAVDFWVARPLGELGRWASRSPADALQAVVFFKLEDGEVIELEADQSLMRTAQMTEEGILLAAQPRAHHVGSSRCAGPPR